MAINLGNDIHLRLTLAFAVGLASCEGSTEPPLGSLPVQSVTIVAPSTTVEIKKTLALKAELRDTRGREFRGPVITWSSTSGATVSAEGIVTGVAVAKSTVTAIAEGVSSSIEISVTNVALGSITLSNPNGPISFDGGAGEVIATPRDLVGGATTMAGRTYTVTIDNPSIAVVRTVEVRNAGAAQVLYVDYKNGGAKGTTLLRITIDGITVSQSVTAQ